MKKLIPTGYFMAWAREAGKSRSPRKLAALQVNSAKARKALADKRLLAKTSLIVPVGG